MKPYDKSNSFMRRVTKRVSQLIPGTTWMNMLLGESQSADDPTSASENDDQPPVKKLCTSNNTFSTNNRTCVDTCPSINSPDNHRNSHANVTLSEISAINCAPSTSKQTPKFVTQSNSSSFNHDISNRGENESQSILKFCETSTKIASSPSFRWDTFVNYGELSERQKLFAQKSPLNCSQVMYGGRSARSNLSKLLGNAPPIHRKTVIPISPTNNSEIRTTSSILLGHISTKDKEIEENKFIIQPRVPLRHKANHKSLPLKIETTVKIDTTPEKKDDKSTDHLSIGSQSRKLRANISKKARGAKPEELEMPVKVDLPNISLSVPVLPNIQFSNINSEDNEFTFNQPLTLEQYSSQIIEKTCKKKQRMAFKKLQNTNSIGKMNSSSTIVKPLINISSRKNEKIALTKNDERIENSSKNDMVSCILNNDLKDTPVKCIQSSNSKLESIKPLNNSPLVLISNNKEILDVSDKDKTNCVEHQTPVSDNSQKPFKISKSSTWTCDTCWVPNKNEVDVCVACQTQKPGTVKKVVEQSTWSCDACWVKNKSECVSCISCGTLKPGSVPETKPQPQFSFGLNNNTLVKSSGSQFKFGFDNTNTNTNTNTNPSSPSQFKFGFDNTNTNTNPSSPSQFKFVVPTTFKTSENSKSAETPITEFKFGMVNNKTEQPLGTFKFGIGSATSQPIKKASEVSNISTDNQPITQFKFGYEGKPNQPDNKLNFGLNATSDKPIAQFQFSLDKTKTDNSIQENLATDNNVTLSTNEFKNIVNNNSNEITEKSEDLQNKNSEFKFVDTKQSDKPFAQATFSFVETNSSNSNSLIKSEDSSKSDQDKVETNPFNLGVSQTVPSTTGCTNQLVNGHSHSNETLSEGLKPGLIKTSQLFSFSSLAKQDQNLPDDQKKPKPFTFGATINDNKPFITPTLTTSSFSSSSTIFGLNNTVFGSGPTTSTPTSLSTSLSTPQFSFGLMAPPTSNSFFSKAPKENDNKTLTQTSNSFTSTTPGGFSFGAQSPMPVFNVSNVSGLPVKPVQPEDQTNSAPNNIFSQSSTKHTMKLDPNMPLTSINFTGGATTQFTAKPETTEPKQPRKILKPVRRIR